MKRSERGHVFTEIYILVAGLGIATAIFVPKWQQTRVDAGIHQCALALDAALAANATGTCPIDPVHFEFVHKDDGSLCCANPGVHRLTELCAKPGDPPAAVVHPEPSKLRRVGSGGCHSGRHPRRRHAAGAHREHRLLRAQPDGMVGGLEPPGLLSRAGNRRARC